MLPKGFLVGNVATDPQVGVSQNSQKNYARFSVACDDRFTRPNEAARTHFFNFISWGRNAHFIQEFVKKGDKVFVEFYVSTSTYTNQEGKNIKNIDFCVDNIEKIGGRSNQKREFDTDSGNRGGAPSESSNIEEETDDISLDDLF